MDFKKQFFDNYFLTHGSHLYGDPSLKLFEDQFPVWEYYYSKYLPLSLNSHILDLGCGTGGFVYFLQSFGYANSIGVDVSEQQINQAIKLGIHQVLVSDISKYLCNAELQDCIVARDVIEHFTRQQVFDLINLISSKTNKDGCFIMQVPNGEGIYFPSIYYGDLTHETAFTSSSIRQLFLNAGFSSVHCVPVNPFARSWRGHIRQLLWKYKVASHRFWKWIESHNKSGIFTSNIIAIGYK